MPSKYPRMYVPPFVFEAWVRTTTSPLRGVAHKVDLHGPDGSPLPLSTRPHLARSLVSTNICSNVVRIIWASSILLRPVLSISCWIRLCFGQYRGGQRANAEHRSRPSDERAAKACFCCSGNHSIPQSVPIKSKEIPTSAVDIKTQSGP